MAQQVAGTFEEVVSEDDVWRFVLEVDGKSLLWRGPPDDEITRDDEPDAGFLLRLELLILGRLVPESWL